MNNVTLMGRLTRDPDVRYTNGENSTCIARYTLAVDRRVRAGQEKQADFISCVAFGKSGEFAEKYLRKGTKIVLTGHIQTGSYTNREGQKVYTTQVVVETAEFGESKKAEGGGGANVSPVNNVNEVKGEAEEDFLQVPDDFDDEELPFN